MFIFLHIMQHKVSVCFSLFFFFLFWVEVISSMINRQWLIIFCQGVACSLFHELGIVNFFPDKGLWFVSPAFICPLSCHEQNMIVIVDIIHSYLQLHFFVARWLRLCWKEIMQLFKSHNWFHWNFIVTYRLMTQLRVCLLLISPFKRMP